MVTREIIATDQAPGAIGTYSQAVKVGDVVYMSGQIPLHPQTMAMVEGSIEAQVERVFENLSAVAQAAGGRLSHIVKLTVYLTDLSDFACVNDVMGRYFDAPYPARAAVEVAALPRGAGVEMDAILHLGG